MLYASLCLAAVAGWACGERLRHDVEVFLGLDAEETEEAQLHGADELFRWVVFNGVSVEDTQAFHCGSKSYSFDAPLGKGFEGVTVLVRGQGGASERLVAKLTRSPAMDGSAMSSAALRLQKECQHYRTLEAAGVPHTLACEAECSHGPEGDEHYMAILKPFVERAKPWTGTWIGGPVFNASKRPFGPGSPRQITGREAEPAELGRFAPQVERALRLSFETVWAMLRIPMANTDQHHNILYQEDGTPTFIDMGMAEDLSKEMTSVLPKEFYVEGFLSAAFELIPPLMLDWSERELILPRPQLPDEVETLVKRHWSHWKESEGKALAVKEDERLRKEMEETCRLCPKVMCDFGSFKERCAACPECQN
jgi:hypothetical protein